MKKWAIKNLLGQRFGKLVVTGRTSNSKRGEATWICKCDCGGTTESTGHNLRQGISRSCGCNRRKPKGVAFLNQKYRKYKEDAKKRGHIFNLSKEDFYGLVSKPCHYCNDPPKVNGNPSTINKRQNTLVYPTGIPPHNGLDRIDNLKGYTIDNVVPCCKNCNWAKGKKTTEQFRDWLRRAYYHWGRF